MKKIFKKYVVFFLFVCFMSLPLISEYVDAAPSGGYKLVNFKTKGIGENTSYTEVATGKAGYTNGSYGAEAAYLGTSGDKIKFKMAGVVGYVSKSEVQLVPMETQADYDKYYTSFYKVQDGAIVHMISLDVYASSYGIATLGKNNVGLSNGTYYLSYDGHYFYPASLAGYKQMIDDYIAGTYSHAVNAGRPFYSYYQFLSHRTKTNYTAADIANYISSKGYTSKIVDRFNIKSHESQLYGEQDAFIKHQNAYGANALLMLSVALNESGEGRSNIAARTNNIFGHAAYDASPGASASGYDSVSNSILAHAKYFVSIDYMDPKDYLSRYQGGHLGSKASGFNIKYASDPYWAEKAIKYYYTFDKRYGFQDYGAYTLGIKTTHNVYNIYKEPNASSNVIYNTGNNTDYSVVILEEVTGTTVNGSNKWYKIQADPVLNAGRTAFIQDVGEYNYDNNYAYIHSSAIDVVLKNGVATVNKNYTITFNANGGVFTGNTGTKNVTVTSGVVPQIENPTRTGYDFVGWNETVVPATSNKTYTATWKIKTYDITFNANGGTFSDKATSRTVKTNYAVKPTVDEPTREGYIFKGWTPTVVAASQNATYTANWEKTVFYDVIFNADGGVFSNGKEELVVPTAKGSLPKVERPIKDGYVFVGWTPELKEVKENASYEAIWKKGTIEDYLTKKDGNFYFNYLKNNNGKLTLQGYQTIQGFDNNLNKDITYMIVYKNIDSGEEFKTLASRITNFKDIPKQVYSPDGFDYTYTWFNAQLDIDTLPIGDYQLYIIAYTDKVYAKSLISNKGYKEQDTNYEGTSQVAITGNNYDSKNSYVELSIRKNFLTKKTSSYIYNQYDKYKTIEFTLDHKLHIIGNVYSYGMDLGKNTNVSRKIIFEDKKTYKTYTKNLGSVVDGGYNVYLPVTDNLSKSRAWYNTTIDISDIPVGDYVIYLSTTSNIADINKMTEKMGRDLSSIKTITNGKEYSFSVNTNFGNRIEMKVEK